MILSSIVTIKDIWQIFIPILRPAFIILTIILVVLLAIYLYFQLITKKGGGAPKILVTLAEIIGNLISFSDEQDYSDAYQAKYLLTKNEWYNYQGLKQYATEHNLMICPKVRLLDLVEPKEGRSDYRTLLNKVQSKHVDFVICDSDMRVKVILELDDRTHERSDRQQRDAFVDTVLAGAGYKILHCRSINETTITEIDNILNPNKTATCTSDK